MPSNPDIAASMVGLADALCRAKESPNEAIELAKQAIEIRKSTLPPGHAAIWNATSVLGGAYTAARQFDAAKPLLIESYEKLKATGPKRWRVDAASRLASYYEELGDTSEVTKWREVLKNEQHANN
jgi:hypothetical protein